MQAGSTVQRKWNSESYCHGGENGTEQGLAGLGNMLMLNLSGSTEESGGYFPEVKASAWAILKVSGMKRIRRQSTAVLSVDRPLDRGLPWREMCNFNRGSEEDWAPSCSCWSLLCQAWRCQAGSKHCTHTGQRGTETNYEWNAVIFKDRFTHWWQVLRAECLTGRCYWEVQRRGEGFL